MLWIILALAILCITSIIITYLVKFKCHHKWVVKQEIDCVYDGHSLPSYTKYVCQCEKCGEIKVYKA